MARGQSVEEGRFAGDPGAARARPKVLLRAASDADWWTYYGGDVPTWWTGIVAEDAHMLLGMGGVYRGVDGRIWAFFHRARGAPVRIAMQRGAKALFAALREVGVTDVYAIASKTIPGAAYWMTRLGFVQTNEERAAHVVWVWRPELSIRPFKETNHGESPERDHAAA